MTSSPYIKAWFHTRNSRASIKVLTLSRVCKYHVLAEMLSKMATLFRVIKSYIQSFKRNERLIPFLFHSVRSMSQRQTGS